MAGIVRPLPSVNCRLYGKDAIRSVTFKSMGNIVANDSDSSGSDWRQQGQTEPESSSFITNMFRSKKSPKEGDREKKNLIANSRSTGLFGDSKQNASPKS